MRPQKSTTRFALLGFLSWKPMSGYEISRFVRDTVGNFWQESAGQIYPQLHAMLKQGLIEELQGQPSGNRTRRLYRITQAGRQVFLDWLEISPTVQKARDELLLKIFFSGEGDEGRVISQLEDEITLMRHALLHYERIETNLRTFYKDNPGLAYWLITLDFGKARAQTRIEWCERTIEQLNTNRCKAENPKEMIE